MIYVKDILFQKGHLYWPTYGKSSVMIVVNFKYYLISYRAFTHDPELYKDPMAFNPQRFLPTTQNPFSEPDPRSFVFGFGRRACPGRTLADANIFLLVAQSLAVFNISSSVHDGHPPSTYPEFLPGLISHPAPFDLSICPRSDSHRKIIEELEEQYPWESSNLEMLQNLTV